MFFFSYFRLKFEDFKRWKYMSRGLSSNQMGQRLFWCFRQKIREYFPITCYRLMILKIVKFDLPLYHNCWKKNILRYHTYTLTQSIFRFTTYNIIYGELFSKSIDSPQFVRIRIYCIGPILFNFDLIMNKRFLTNLKCNYFCPAPEHRKYVYKISINVFFYFFQLKMMVIGVSFRMIIVHHYTFQFLI